MTSIEFLAKWKWPAILTAIAVDRKGIDTDTFESPGLVLEWLTRYHNRNHYFQVNPSRTRLHKKASKTDILELRWHHVDIDFRAGENHEDEYARILKLVENPPCGVPRPTCALFSGGGFQAFWRREEPIPINGDPAAADEAARYNLQLELVFGADQCHNVDRIMRLPGTTNYPDARKRAKGRTERLAEILWFDDGDVSSGAFTQAAKVQVVESAGGDVIEITTGNVRRLDDVHELDGLATAEVKDWLKVLIVQGNRPDDEDPYKSKSHALFGACCGLVRAGVPDDVIYSVITDPDFGISAHVIAQKSGAERAALRAIGNAKLHVEDPDLLEFNERYAVIQSVGNKCRIVETIIDDAANGRSCISLLPPADFSTAWMHRYKEIVIGKDKEGKPKTKEVSIGRWWLGHTKRRTYSRITFAPGREVPGAYNMWKGFAVDAIPGDCSLFLEHIKENVCSGNKEHYDFLIGWMARMVQSPGAPARTAIVMRGRQGTGKSFFAHALGRLLGQHYMAVSNAKHLTGNFNGHLQDCVLLFADEAFYAGNKSGESVLKSIISEDQVPIERKGFQTEMQRNCLHVIMASNEDWVVPANADDRRFFVLDVSDRRACDVNYFGRIDKQLEDEGGYEALLHYLMNVDLALFDARTVPKTSALRAQKEMSLRPKEEWWLSCLQDGSVVASAGWPEKAAVCDMLYELAVFCKGSNKFIRTNTTAVSLARFLKKMTKDQAIKTRSRMPLDLPTIEGKLQTVARPYFWVLPPLEDCRQIWDEIMYKEHWQAIVDDDPEKPDDGAGRF